jgi:hypothetical protein
MKTKQEQIKDGIMACNITQAIIRKNNDKTAKLLHQAEINIIKTNKNLKK